MILKNNRRYIFGIGLLIAGILLAACGGGSQNDAPSAGGGGEAFDLISGPVPVPELGYEFGREELAATDPASVSVDAGYPQVIEFFAFW